MVKDARPSTKIDKNALVTTILTKFNKQIMSNQYLEQIELLKKDVRDVDEQLTASDVKMYMWLEVAQRKEERIKSITSRNEWLENRNKQLKGSKGSHYPF